MNRDLLALFIRGYVAQPATALWRAVEIDAIRRFGLPDGSGLDVGCGDGKLTKIVLDLVGSRSLVGVDLDPLETAQARHSGVYCEVFTTSAASIPVPDGSFDFALSNSVLEHIPELEAVIAEVSRVLKSGGSFTITVPTVGFHRNLKGARAADGHRRAEYLRCLDARLAHFHYLSKSEWRELLESHGMCIEKVFGYLDSAEVQRWETLSRCTGGLLYAMSGRRSRPIEIQRGLRMRQLQNLITVPRSAANLLARWFASGLSPEPIYWQRPEGLDDNEAGCLLIVARKL